MSVPATPAGETVSRLLEEVRSSDRPVLPAKFKQKDLSEKRAKELLEQLTSEKQIYRWPGRSAVYWREPAERYAAQQMLSVASEAALSREDLPKRTAKRCFRKFSEDKCKPIMKELLRTGELSELKEPGAPRKKLLFAKERPAAYLQALAGYVETLLKGLQAQAGREQFIRILQGPAEPQQKEAEPVQKETAERVYAALLEMQAKFNAHILARELRHHPSLAGLSKQDFDAAVLQLAKDQRVQLSRHDDVFHMNDERRQELVFEPPDRYYVALSVRD